MHLLLFTVISCPVGRTDLYFLVCDLSIIMGTVMIDDGLFYLFSRMCCLLCLSVVGSVCECSSGLEALERAATATALSSGVPVSEPECSVSHEMSSLSVWCELWGGASLGHLCGLCINKSYWFDFKRIRYRLPLLLQGPVFQPRMNSTADDVPLADNPHKNRIFKKTLGKLFTALATRFKGSPCCSKPSCVLYNAL
jgi:hypothetical protein